MAHNSVVPLFSLISTFGTSKITMDVKVSDIWEIVPPFKPDNVVCGSCFRKQTATNGTDSDTQNSWNIGINIEGNRTP